MDKPASRIDNISSIFISKETSFIGSRAYCGTTVIIGCQFARPFSSASAFMVSFTHHFLLFVLWLVGQIALLLILCSLVYRLCQSVFVLHLSVYLSNVQTCSMRCDKRTQRPVAIQSAAAIQAEDCPAPLAD